MYNLYCNQQVQSAILYVKRKVYEAMDNRAIATDCYKHALHYDVYSYQAFEALVQNQMLSAAEGDFLLIYINLVVDDFIKILFFQRGNYWTPCHLLSSVKNPMLSS